VVVKVEVVPSMSPRGGAAVGLPPMQGAPTIAAACAAPLAQRVKSLSGY